MLLILIACSVAYLVSGLTAAAWMALVLGVVWLALHIEWSG